MFKEKSRFFRVGQWGYFSRYNDFRVGGGAFLWITYILAVDLIGLKMSQE